MAVEEAGESGIAAVIETPVRATWGEAEPAPRSWYARRPVLLVAALYLLIVLVELAAPISRGQWYTAADLGQEWPTTSVPHASEPVKNPIQGDVYTQIDPDLKLDIESIRSGHLPLWNPDNGNGEPLLGGLVAAPFSPFTVPFYVLPFAVALVVSAGLKLWCLAFFTFLWLRRLLRRDLAAVLGGLLFAFAGFQIIWLNWQVQVGSAVALPFGLWCAQVALDWLPRRAGSPREALTRRRILRLCLAGGALAPAAAVLGGHPEVAVFNSVAWGLYCLAGGVCRLGLKVRFVKWILSAGLAAVIGVGVSTVVLLPFFQYEAVSSRTAYIQSEGPPTQAALHAWAAPLIAFPNLLGSPSTKYDDAAYYTQHATDYAEINTTFMGLVALCLAPLGLAGCFARRTRFVAGVGFGLVAFDLFLLYTRLGARTWRALPVVGKAVLSRGEDILILGTVTCVAVGVDWLLVGPRRGPWRDWRWRAATGLTTGGVVAVLAVLDARSLRRQAGGAATAAGSSYVRGQIAIQLVCAVLVFGLLVLLIHLARRRWAAMAASTAVVAAAAVSVMLPLIAWNPTVPGSIAYPETKDVSALRKVVGHSLSMYAGGVFPPAMTNAWFGLEDVGSYDALGVVWRDDLYDKAFGVAPTPLGAGNSRTEQMPVCIDDLRLFGIQHVVGGTGVFGDSSRLSSHVVDGSSPFDYYDVPDSSLVSLIGESATIAGDATAMAAVTNCAFDANSEVIISPNTFDAAGSSPESPMTGSVLSGASARVTQQSSTSLTVRTTALAGAWLVVRQTWFPGWQAQVDGRPTAVRRADVAFQAVRVPAGTHVVTLRYAPKQVSIGLEVSVASVVVIVLICLWAAADWPAGEWGARSGRKAGAGAHSKRL